MKLCLCPEVARSRRPGSEAVCTGTVLYCPGDVYKHDICTVTYCIFFPLCPAELLLVVLMHHFPPNVLSQPLGPGRDTAHLLSKHEAKLGLIILLTPCPSLASVLDQSYVVYYVSCILNLLNTILFFTFVFSKFKCLKPYEIEIYFCNSPDTLFGFSAISFLSSHLIPRETSTKIQGDQ